MRKTLSAAAVLGLGAGALSMSPAFAAEHAELFTNDMSEFEAGKSHLTVRHVAAAPAVDVLAGDQAIITGLENPNEETLPVDAGTVSASVAAAGTVRRVLAGNRR